MEKLKLMTILGTRPEIIRLSACIKACDTYFDHILVHTGQNWDYTLNQVFFDDLGLRAPAHYLNCAGADLGQTMGNIITRSYDLMRREKPDAVLLLGDTNSTLSAISAKRLKIPIFHMEAGNRCWDWNVPEMINRKIIDHISDVNLPYTEHARRYLLSEGLDGKMIFVTGSPMSEVLHRHREEIAQSDVLSRLSLEEKAYFLVSAHREENIDNDANFLELMHSINYIADKYGMPVIYPAHPRSMRTIKAHQFPFSPFVRLVKPFGFFDYVKLQMNSACVLSDSGTLSEESAILGFAGVLIRTSTERPETLDKGSVVIGGIRQDDVARAVALALALRGTSEGNALPADYGDLHVSIKVVNLIESYTKIVNKTVWGK
ncbi:UDP-N-acetylglucosamine 2-epimerase (non-hydrolyzing) [Oscillospiraceae bacterium WX1]